MIQNFKSIFHTPTQQTLTYLSTKNTSQAHDNFRTFMLPLITDCRYTRTTSKLTLNKKIIYYCIISA